MLHLTVLVAALTLLAFGALWSGYVLTILWSWFVVPVFALPALALAPAIGLALVAGYLTHQYVPNLKAEGSEWDKVGHVLTHTTVRPMFALFIGWVVQHWM